MVVRRSAVDWPTARRGAACAGAATCKIAARAAARAATAAAHVATAYTTAAAATAAAEAATWPSAATGQDDLPTALAIGHLDAQVSQLLARRVGLFECTRLLRAEPLC